MARVDFSNSPRFLADLKRAVNNGLTLAAIDAAGHAKRSMGRGGRFRSSAPGTPPNVQRGILRNAIAYQPSTELRSAMGVVANVNYARIQETGGTITGKGKHLTVPVNDAAKRFSEKVGSVRLGRFAVIRSRRGALLLVGADKLRYRNKGAGININDAPVFVLKRSIRLPARPFLRPAVFGRATELGAIVRNRVTAGIRPWLTGGRR